MINIISAELKNIAVVFNKISEDPELFDLVKAEPKYDKFLKGVVVLRKLSILLHESLQIAE